MGFRPRFYARICMVTSVDWTSETIDSIEKRLSWNRCSFSECQKSPPCV